MAGELLSEGTQMHEARFCFKSLVVNWSESYWWMKKPVKSEYQAVLLFSDIDLKKIDAMSPQSDILGMHTGYIHAKTGSW